jgi:hypothetical protein
VHYLILKNICVDLNINLKTTKTMKTTLSLYNTVEIFDEVTKNWFTDYVAGISARSLSILGSAKEIEWKNVRGKVLTDDWFDEYCFEDGDSFTDQGLWWEWSENGKNYIITDKFNGTIITTVKYVHEAENLFKCLVGQDVVNSSSLESSY